MGSPNLSVYASSVFAVTSFLSILSGTDWQLGMSRGRHEFKPSAKLT
jgi:hypothetical protein